MPRMKSYPTSIRSKAVICISGLYSRSAHTGEISCCKFWGFSFGVALLEAALGSCFGPPFSVSKGASLVVTFEVYFLPSSFLALGPIRSLLKKVVSRV